MAGTSGLFEGGSEIVMFDEKIYGLIVEYKTEGPIIMELKPMTSDEAYNRMAKFEADSRVIRVAVFKMVHHTGHEALIPKETHNG